MRPGFLILAVMSLSFPAVAFDLRTDSEGDLVRWAHPLELVIDSHLAQQLKSPGANEAVLAAIANLDDATPFLDVTARVGDARPIGYVVGASDNTNSIVVLDDWPYAEGTLAVTLVTLNARTNELLDADIAFNADEHHFKVLPEGARRDDDFDDVQNTITHELGHVLGLMHNNTAPDLVMYPSAAPGELTKRQLKQDDRDGLLSLYGVATEAPVPAVVTPPAMGCSSTSTASTWALCFALVTLLLRRRRVALALIALPALAFAGEPSRLRAVTRAEDVAVVQVTARQSYVHPQHPGLIVTALTLSPRECLKGQCANLDVVVVPGGRVGEIEQYVAHDPVPLAGEQIIVTRRTGKVRLLTTEPTERLELIRALRSGSPAPLQAVQPHSTSLQVPAITP